MKTNTRVVVIGGGVVGCSVLYHLTKLGWSDVILLERSELTSGSTWHAAGGFHTLNGDTNMAALQGYTIRLYRELEEITGMSCGLHHVGGITLADNQERFDMLLAERAKHRYMGLDTQIIGPDEIRNIAPITNTDGIIGALYDPLDGHLDPSGTTHAYAKAARMGGATIETHCKVIETNQRPDGTWDVVTDKGTIHTEHVVNAGGLWAREVGAMAGVYLPLHPMEHQYIVTDEIPVIYERDSEHPHVMDPSGESYLRQEGRGLCIGFYEQPCKPWAVDGTPWEFGHELLADDFDKINDSIEFAYKRFPVLETAGVKSVIHGPFTFAPDGNPLVGPIPGLRNYWSACGVMAGFSQGGGVGLMLAQWMIEGETERDTMAMDVARFGEFATPDWGSVKSTENYERRFVMTFPNETLPKGRMQKTTALYDRLVAKGARMDQSFGLEHALWFADGPSDAHEDPTFERNRSHDYVAREVKAVREAVGGIEIANFAKHEFQGAGARAYLDRVLAGHIPKPGRLTLTPMLTPKGKLYGDLTVACLAEDRFMLFGSGTMQDAHRRWFEKDLPADVRYANVSDVWHGIALSGPQSRALLARITRADVSAEGFKFRDLREGFVGGVPALVNRISFSGELGYEIYCKPQYLLRLAEAIEEAGADLGYRWYGARALMSLRLEKSWGAWALDYRPDFNAVESGLDGFINWRKEFVGKAATEAVRSAGAARKLVTLVVDVDGIDVSNDEAILHGGKAVGYVSSGGYAHHVGKSMAMGYVDADHAAAGNTLQVEILGQFYDAEVLGAPLYDANGANMRS